MDDPAIAKALANVAAQFTHLENHLASILAVLMGTWRVDPATYVIRAIKSPRGRIDVLTALLEKAPINMALPVDYDEILREFWSINKRRNAYVHGTWWTRDEDKTTWLAEEVEHGLGFAESRPVKADELEALTHRMWLLENRIQAQTDYDLRRLTPPPAPREPQP